MSNIFKIGWIGYFFLFVTVFLGLCICYSIIVQTIGMYLTTTSVFFTFIGVFFVVTSKIKEKKNR